MATKDMELTRSQSEDRKVVLTATEADVVVQALDVYAAQQLRALNKETGAIRELRAQAYDAIRALRHRLAIGA